MHTNIVTSEGRSTIVLVLDDGSTRLINDTDVVYARVLESILAGNDPTEWLTSSTDWFKNQYDADQDEIDDDYDDYIDDDDEDRDDDVVIESLASTIARYRIEGRDPSGLVAFMDRLAKNPSYRSREQLWNWTQAKDLTIDADGYIVGYKGVCRRLYGSDEFPLDRYPFQSSSSGHGFVDGIEIENGNLPMGVGAVLSMPREEVQDDPTIGCHSGLHVGNFSYASGFAHVLIEVRFDPADVVSVPTDCGFTKLRCCRYEVVAVHEAEGDDLSAHEAEASWDAVETIDSFEIDMPTGFFAPLMARLKGKGKR